MRYIELIESVETVTVMGKSISVMRNPGELQLLAAARRKEMRGLVDRSNGDTYWWPASQGIHSSVAINLGLTGDVYEDNANSRLMIRGSDLTIISGAGTVMQSRSIAYLASPAQSIRIKRGDTLLTFDEWTEKWIESRKRYAAWHAAVVADDQRETA